MELEIPMKLKSTLNTREHWSTTYRRSVIQKNEVGWALRGTGFSSIPAARLGVTLTRIYTGRAKPMDDDNLSAAFKSVRDGVATHLGIDDGDPRVRYRTAQERGLHDAVRIAIETTED